MHDRTSFHGIDPHESRQQARGMRSGAGELSSMVAGIGSMLQQVTWSGRRAALPPSTVTVVLRADNGAESAPASARAS